MVPGGVSGLSDLVSISITAHDIEFYASQIDRAFLLEQRREYL